MRRTARRKLTEAQIRQLPPEQLYAATLNNDLPEEVRELARMHARAREVRDLSKLEPLDHGVLAKPHTPIYRMHRYWARRPWSVFNELLIHYSNPGSIVLDPFCGGGVTVVEGVRLGRKMVGADLSPLATWITRTELAQADLHQLDIAFERLGMAIADRINGLYATECRRCGKPTVAEWIEHSAVATCPKCGRELVLAHTTKAKARSVGAAGGGYMCPCSPKPFRPALGPDRRDVLVRLRYRCRACGVEEDAAPLATDTTLYARVEDEFDDLLQAGGLEVPADPIPDADLERENSLYKKGIVRFADLFTKRNLVANARLRRAILDLDCDEACRRLLLFAFSASLQHTNRMVRARSAVSPGGRLIEWATHAFWVPDCPVERNVWSALADRVGWVQRGLKWSKEHLAPPTEASSVEDLSTTGTHWLLTRSSHALPLPGGSVDAVITDPPYGGNVQYSELTDFFTVWLRGTGVLDEEVMQGGLVKAADEAIQTRHAGFEAAKSLSHYRDMLYKILRECHRVLKPNRWMVMTFHNLNFHVWNAINAAAHDAGFIVPEKDGMIYQPPIRGYLTTIQLRRPGSMLGDFIISFKRARAAPRRRMIPEVEIGSRVRRVAAEAVQYHGGATLSTIYMRLMPYLVNSGLLEKVQEGDLVPFLRDQFELRPDEEGNQRWVFREDVEGTGEAREPLDFVPVEARIEYVIRSFLRANRSASKDEILGRVYSQLINSNAAEYYEIDRVLRRACRLAKPTGKGREVYVLRDIPKEQLAFAGLLAEADDEVEPDTATRRESEHDLVIEELAKAGARQQYGVHIGRPEQNKYALFRRWSRPMVRAQEFGILPEAFDRIVNIDVLWLKDRNIVYAFEVEKSTTIDSAITRFRELFAGVPNLRVQAQIAVPDDRQGEVERKLGSPANRRDGLTERVRYILFSDILGKKGTDPTKAARLAV